MKRSVAHFSTTTQEWTILKYIYIYHMNINAPIISMHIVYSRQASEARRKRIKELGGVRRLSRKQVIGFFIKCFTVFSICKFSISPWTPPSIHHPLWGGKEADLFPCPSPSGSVCAEAVCRDIWESCLVGQTSSRGVISLWAHVHRRGPYWAKLSVQGCHWTIWRYITAPLNFVFSLNFNNNCCFKIRQVWCLAWPFTVIRTPAHNMLH